MENTSNSDSNLSDEMVGKIRKILKRDGGLILKKIYEMPGINHKTLGEELNKNKNNLSNMLKHIKDSKISLIVIENQGTQKHYFLTALAQEYVEQEILSGAQNAAQSHKTNYDAPPADKDIVQKTLDSLELFKREAQENNYDWKLTLNDLMSEKKETISAGVKAAYVELTKLLYQCKIEDGDALSRIFESLENSFLAGLFKSYLDKKFYYYDGLKQLSSLHSSNSTAAYKVINNIFSVLYPFVFFPDSNSEKEPNELVPQEYDDILVYIAKLSAEFYNKRYTSDSAVKQWHASYFLDETLAFHIAEKCLTLKNTLPLLS